MMIFSAAFLTTLLITSSVQGSTAPKPQIIIKDLPEYGLNLLPSTDARFLVALNAVLKGIVDPAVEADRSFGVLLENQSDVDLVAYTVRWTGTDSAGTTFEFIRAFYHSQWIDDPNFRIHAGGSGVFAPSLYVTNSHLDFRTHASPPHPQRWERMAEMATVEISLDAALFKDGRFVGPDESRTYEQLMAGPLGRKATMEELLARHLKGESDTALLDWMQSVADARYTFGDLFFPSQLNKQDAARLFLTKHKSAGAESAFALAAQVAALPMPNVTRVPYTGK
jgi:hypothetical protein